MNKRVYILDIEAVSPIGIGLDAITKNLRANLSATDYITGFDTSGLDLKIAAEIKTDLSTWYQNEDERIQKAIRFDRKFELSCTCYQLMKNKLPKYLEDMDQHRAGVIMGVGADVPMFEEMEDQVRQANKELTEPYLNTVYQHNFSPGYLNTLLNPLDLHALFLAERIGLRAFQKSILTACASSTQAVALASRSIMMDQADLVLAGGTDSILNLLAFISFEKIGALAFQADPVQQTCKPFDINRKGTVAGEAAGLCLLASEEYVAKRGLSPRFEILGYGNSLDAYQITSPDPSGRGIEKALTQSLTRAGIKAADIDYINLHGTATQLNDPVELKALKTVLGPDLDQIPISSTKDRHGHAIAAAGIQELAVLCAAMEGGFIPHNLNLRKPIETEGVQLLMDQNLNQDINIGMTCNYSFGGVNTVLIIKKIC